MKCSKCLTVFSGRSKRSFLGFRKFTCTSCNAQNVGTLGLYALIAYTTVSGIAYLLYLYDLLTFTTLPDFSTLFENTFRGTYFWVVIIGIPLFFHFNKLKQSIFQVVIVTIVFGTPFSAAIYGEYAKSSVKNLLLKANKENYALSKNLQILTSLIQNPNIGEADAIKLVAESTNETFDIMHNYKNLHKQLILPNSQFKRVSDFLSYKEEQANVLHKVFSKITSGDLDSLDIDITRINNLQISATNAIKSN